MEKQLLSEIRSAFEDAIFPSHCGLHAACARDDWIDDEEQLRRITLRDDFVGDWWDVPDEHLLDCMMALSYLDKEGMKFYLPAYMTAVVERPEQYDSASRSSSWQVVFTLLPPSQDNEPLLRDRFKMLFDGFDSSKRNVVRKFLNYVCASDLYNTHAREISGECLSEGFWNS